MLECNIRIRLFFGVFFQGDYFFVFGVVGDRLKGMKVRICYLVYL